MIQEVLLGLVLLLILVLSSGAAVEIFEKLASELKIRRLMLATVLIGFSTSLPELFVGIMSAVEGQPQIALGDIIGANLANLSWIIGGAAIIAKAIPVVGDYVRKDLWVTVGLAMAPFLMLTDGSLTRLDGILLIFLYVLYVNDMIRQGSTPIRHSKLVRMKEANGNVKTLTKIRIHIAQLVVSLLVLGTSAYFLIEMAINLSTSLGVSTFWIGLMVISVGTTLPELVLSILAARRKDLSLILGNVLGSVVVNSTLVLGTIAVISPITYTETLPRGVAGVFLILILGMFWLFTRTKRKLERWEGAVLIGIYLMFVGVQLLIA